MDINKRLFPLFLLVFSQASLLAGPKANTVVLVDSNHPARRAFVRGSNALKENNTAEALKQFKVAHTLCMRTNNADDELKRFQYSLEYNIGALLCIENETQDLPQATEWLTTCLEHIHYDINVFYCANALFFLTKTLWESGIDASPDNEVVLKQIYRMGQQALSAPILGTRERLELTNMLFEMSGTIGILESCLPTHKENKRKFEDGASRLTVGITRVREHAADLAERLQAGSLKHSPAHSDLVRLGAIEFRYKQALANCQLKLGHLHHKLAREKAQSQHVLVISLFEQAQKYYGIAEQTITFIVKDIEVAQTSTNDYSAQLKQVTTLQSDVHGAYQEVNMGLGMVLAKHANSIEEYDRSIALLAPFAKHKTRGKFARLLLVQARLNRAMALLNATDRDDQTDSIILTDLSFVIDHTDDAPLKLHTQGLRGACILKKATKTKDLKSGLADLEQAQGLLIEPTLMAQAHLTLAERTQGAERTEHLQFAIEHGSELIKNTAQEMLATDVPAAADARTAYEALVKLTQTSKSKSLAARKKKAALTYAKELLAQGQAQQALLPLREAGNNQEALALRIETLCQQEEAKELLHMLLTGIIDDSMQIPEPLRYTIATQLVASIETLSGTVNPVPKALKKKFNIVEQLLESIPVTSEHYGASQVLHARLLACAHKNDEARALLLELAASGNSEAYKLHETLLLDVITPREVIEQERAQTPTRLEAVIGQLRAISPAQDTEVQPTKKKKKKKTEAVPAQAPQDAAPTPPAAIEPTAAIEPIPEPVQIAAVPAPEPVLTPMPAPMAPLPLDHLAAMGNLEAFMTLSGHCLYANRVWTPYLLSLLRTQEQHAHLVRMCEHAHGSCNPRAAFIAGVFAMQRQDYACALRQFNDSLMWCPPGDALASHASYHIGLIHSMFAQAGLTHF